MSEHKEDFTGSGAFRLRMEQTMRRHGMFAPGQTVVVAVSGGPDSTALLHALSALREAWELSLVVAHLNHGFRGAESDAEAEYVRELCAVLGVPCREEWVDVPAVQRERHLSAQEAAREVRHAFLRRVAAQTGAARIALGHTRDDRAETVLLNIFRGTGMEGLSGFPPTAFPLVRPLYATTRQEVEAYCAIYGLVPRQDSSNTKTRYRRNRARLEILPQLRAHFNPQIEDALLRLADLARDDDAALEALAIEALHRLASPAGRGTALRLARWQLKNLPIALQRRVLRLAILRLRGSLKDVHFQVIENILSFSTPLPSTVTFPSENTTEKAIENPGKESNGEGESYGVDLPVWEGRTIRVRTDRAVVELSLATVVVEPQIDWQVRLSIPGTTLLERRSDGQVGKVVIEGYLCPLAMLEEVWASLKTGRIAVWRRADVRFPLRVRSWRRGDRIRPRGMGGTKKLQDLFTDAHIPAGLRRQIPLLVEDDGEGRILAVGDWRYDETALLVGYIEGTAEATSREKKSGAETNRIDGAVEPKAESILESTLESKAESILEYSELLRLKRTKIDFESDFERMLCEQGTQAELLVLHWGYE